MNSRELALACASRWYEIEIAERSLATSVMRNDGPTTWPAVCDLFIVDVKARVRGADSSRHEAEKRAAFLRRSPILCTRPIGEHDDALALAWLRTILAEPLKRRGADGAPRDPLTVRNAARILGEIYKFARRKGAFPRDRALPTQSDEFRAELAGALKEKAKLRKETRSACPTDTVLALVACEEIPELRRLMRLISFYTGVAPGELHGLQIRDYRTEAGVRVLDVHQQWTLARKGYPPKLAALKTVWRKRKVPVHPCLERQLDRWVTTGWRRHVGRAPQPEDFLISDEEGRPFREEGCEAFLDEIRRVGCDTHHKGVQLDGTCQRV